MDFKTFKNVVMHVVKARNPVLLRGRHGIGKSEIVGQIAQTLGLPLVMRRASQMTEGDLLGLPSIEDNQTVWNPPDWFKKATEEPVLLFLDEVDRAQQEVRQGIFELTDSRSIAGHTLHDGTVIFASINGGEHGAQYSVFEMDPAEADRYTTFDIEPTTKDWILWASENDNVHETVIDFIRDNPMHLEHTGDFEAGKIYPSRRSWKRFSDCCTVDNLFSAALTGDKTAFNAISALTPPYLGLEAAVSFGDHLREGVLVTVEDLLNGKLTDKRIKRMNNNQHNALLDRAEQSKMWEETLTEDQIQNVCRYMVKLPSELFMRAFQALGSANNEQNLVKVTKCEVEGVPIYQYVIHFTQGDPLPKPKKASASKAKRATPESKKTSASKTAKKSAS